MRMSCPPQPEVIGNFEGYELVRFRETFYGVPQASNDVDLNREAKRGQPEVIRGQTCEEVQERICATQDRVPVEFAGWLPVFVPWGNCGKHPQFTHTANPPPGYRFTRSIPQSPRGPSLWQRTIGRLFHRITRIMGMLTAVITPFCNFFQGGPGGIAPRARLRVLAAMIRLGFLLLRKGAKVGPTLRFLRSRHYQSQVLLAPYRGLVFLPSMPYTFGQDPWIVEIEDPTTLFYPFIQNGQTHGLPITLSPYYPIIKTLLEAETCKGIITHMKSTAEMLPRLFGSEVIREKVLWTPLGIKIPARWQSHDESDHIDLLFTNSWHQLPGNFYLRGGLDVLEAFVLLRERYPQLRLTLRTSLPDLEPRYQRIIENGWVRVINRFLSPEELSSLQAASHIYLLPAARVHIVSLLHAMAHGLAVVASDGWGMEEYVKHGHNGLVVNGRYGKVSWIDHKVGMLRENYAPMYRPDLKVVKGLVKAISLLIENRDLRIRLGRNARQDVETNYNLERWNQGLKEAFDRALAPSASRVTTATFKWDCPDSTNSWPTAIDERTVAQPVGNSATTM